MKKSPLQWLTERASPPGILACGLRQPDGKPVCRSGAEGCPAGSMETMLGLFGSLRAAVFSEIPALRWSTWSFEHGQIRFVERPDGWLLGLVVRANSGAVGSLDPLSEEFLALQLGE